MVVCDTYEIATKYTAERFLPRRYISTKCIREIRDVDVDAMPRAGGASADVRNSARKIAQAGVNNLNTFTIQAVRFSPEC